MRDDKTDNGNLAGKLALRRFFLRKFHAGRRPIVFDACAAAGVLWGRLRKEFDVRYMAADREPRRLAIKVDDSARILALPDAVFDVADLDTYGEPWKLLEAAAGSLRGPTTIFLTIGFRRIQGWASGVSPWVIEALGVPKETPKSIVGDLLDWGLMRLVHVALGPCRLRFAAEGPRGRNARYVGLRVDPPAPP